MDWNEIYQTLFQVVRLAGKTAQMMQAGIVNEGKVVGDEVGESERHKAMRQAKTKADEIVQEMLLGAMMGKWADVFTLDVEEDTESIAYFKRKDHAYTLVIDPIDGTLDYLEQKDTYSVCVAVIAQHEVKLAIVYFPQRDILYGYVEGHRPKIYHQVWAKADTDGEELKGKLMNTSLVYKNSRVKDNIQSEVMRRGYEMVDETDHGLCCPEAILKCIRGECVAYYADNRNIRDILLGAIISHMEGGYACDFKGKPLLWKQGGRQPEAVFTLCDPEILFKKEK